MVGNLIYKFDLYSVVDILGGKNEAILSIFLNNCEKLIKHKNAMLKLF